MIRDDATLAQLRAARPDASTWLAANAGSGKTRVLTDRVARLLLSGSDPQNILCLTYTKAAAAEMQNRLFRRLGTWAMLPDAELRLALAELGEPVGAATGALVRARRLFAQAMEVPGGLRIQTIHAFCAGLLRRFPLEAGVTPQFSEMDDRSGTLLRAGILDRMADGPDRTVLDAFLRLAGGDDLEPLLAEICSRGALFAQPFDESGLRSELGLAATDSMAALIADLLSDDARDLLRRVQALCAAGSTNDVKAADKLAGITGTAADLPVLENLLLWGETTRRQEPFSARTGAFPTSGSRDKDPELIAELDDYMERVAAARPVRLGLVALLRARALHDFAHRFVTLYEAAKARRGLLDFDDLISRARRLLEDPAVAQWVLFKLDGGIDHILVDEAQDTSPEQWAVVRGLTQEFAAGQGARDDVRRTIFVVGDLKQSIYSFQGADPEAFDRMQAHFAAELARIGDSLETGSLLHSFRSAPSVLRAVDEVFQGPHLAGLGRDAPQHRAFKADMPGRVDLWPPVPEAPKDADDRHWTEPMDRVGKRHHRRILAERIADRVQEMVGTALIPTGSGSNLRPVHEGDILILVQRRSDLFTDIIRELKARGLRVAGADRLRVGAELAVRDIGATLRFLAMAEDDLSLASALRSPLFGWSEEELYRLAAFRPQGASLWQALRGSGRAGTLAILDDLRGQADFLRPYDLIARLLIRHDGRRRLIARLGTEAEDGIDALMAQALAFEQGAVPGLTGFVDWMQTDETDLKRQMEGRGDSIRVMTVHGSKGLEAPIVILPDTAKRQLRGRGTIVSIGGHPVWAAPSGEATAAQTAIRDEAKRKEEEERRRLLYVAMTRAESWLIVAAAGETGVGGESWHAMVAEGLERAGAAVAEMPGGPGLRLENGDWDSGPIEGKQSLTSGPEPVSAEFAPVETLPEIAATPITPSGLGGAKILPGDTDPDEGEAAMARGSLIHLLLEHLPAAAADRRADLARSLIDGSPDRDLLGATEGLIADVLAMADMDLLAEPALTEIMVTAPLPDGRRVTGLIDRLILRDDRAIVVDYKTNRVVPRNAAEVPEGILRQMGAYALAVQQIWPDRVVETAILWTADATVMPLPRALVMAALQRAAPA
jgi:ATP-dependent helicase/nuclease subunit A